MSGTMVIEQNKALSLEHALKLAREGLEDFGLPTERLNAVEAEPIPNQEYTLSVVAAELAVALTYERIARKKLGFALGELYERVEALEKGAAK